MEKKHKRFFSIRNTSANLDRIAKYVGIILAVSALILSYCTLIEMKKEREISHEPNILFSDSKCKVEMKILNPTSTDYPIYVDYLSCVPQSDTFKCSSIFPGKKLIDPRLRNQFYLRGINVGKGPALNIEYSFSFETLDLINYINDFKEYSFESLDSVFVKDSNIFLLSNRDTSLLSRVVEKTRRIPFISSDFTERLEIKIPDMYFALLSLQQLVRTATTFNRDLLEKNVEKKQFFESTDSNDPPELLLTIEYNDLSNKSFRRTFIIRFQSAIGHGNLYDYNKSFNVLVDLVYDE